MVQVGSLCAPFVDLLAIHADVVGGDYPQANFIPGCRDDGDTNFAADHDNFPDAPCENQHVSLSPLFWAMLPTGLPKPAPLARDEPTKNPCGAQRASRGCHSLTISNP